MELHDRDDDDHQTTDVTGVVPLGIIDDSTARIASTLRLVCVAGPDLGRSFRISEPPLVIGRGAVEVPLQATDVSRHHARIVTRGNTYALEDLGSANGTFVNGSIIRGVTSLTPGDRIQIGSAILILTHHDELEERMYRLQRFEAMAQMAGGIAHDFNNALSVIMVNLDLLEVRMPPATELRDITAQIRLAASSASQLARRMLRLGHKEPLELGPVSLVTLVHRAVNMMRPQLGPAITVDIDVPDDLVVHGSQEELHQVLLNLILNARDAMPDGGTLGIEARTVTFDRAEATSRHLPEMGQYVELLVSDSGVGMSEEDLSRAFEPFFTTKPTGQGTGLGLAMLHGIVRRHGGAVVAHSTRGKGTTFLIWLQRSVS
ncbi:MAG TPA: ATP-binding protein [Kofleriaceae bacterium]|nr:ATP-binding protein [Kofleriaceae bacterium]